MNLNKWINNDRLADHLLIFESLCILSIHRLPTETYHIVLCEFISGITDFTNRMVQ